MNKALYSVLFCAGLVFAQSNMAVQSPNAAPSAPAFTPTVAPPALQLRGDNHSTILRQLADYANSGRYNREVDQVENAAHAWIETRTAHKPPGEKPAAVFDIDDTALSNLPNMLACGFCNSATQMKLDPSDNLPAVRQTLDLYNFAKSKGAVVIFVTGRKEALRDLTARTLQAVGYTGWADLLMRPDGSSEPARTMKAGIRAGIESKGYRIILNIGDQLSDLIGGHSERTYKLPNPFYFVE